MEISGLAPLAQPIAERAASARHDAGAQSISHLQDMDAASRQSGTSRAPVRPGESAFARMLEADPRQDAKLKESCLQLEGLLLKQMLNAMRKSVEKTGLIDGGQAEEIFTDMLYDKYAEEMSRSQVLGLSRTIYQQLTGGKKWV